VGALGCLHLGAFGVERRDAFETLSGAQPRGPAPPRLAARSQPEAALEDAEPRLLRALPGDATGRHLRRGELGVIVARRDLDAPGDLTLPVVELAGGERL